jgi:hypothetical protein
MREAFFSGLPGRYVEARNREAFHAIVTAAHHAQLDRDRIGERLDQAERGLLDAPSGGRAGEQRVEPRNIRGCDDVV